MNGKQPPRSTAHWLLAGLALATVLALLAPLGWPFELFAHFRVQYAAAAVLLAALLGWQRRVRPTVLALVLAAWHALPGAQALVAATPPPVRCGGPALTVATVNLRYSNPRHQAFLAWLDTGPADLVIVQEVTTAWVQDLVARTGYPHQRMLPREDAYGIGVLSRRPLESVSLVDLAGDGLPSVTGVVQIDGRRVRFVGLHTRWPVAPSLAELRDQALGNAAQLAQASDLPTVLLGDLNLTPDSPAFDRLLHDGRLLDALAGRDWQPTWKADFWPLALRIDHILVSPGVCVERGSAGPPVGSDHLPVLAQLRLP